MVKKQEIGPEFSRVVEVEALTDTPSVIVLEANAAERAGLARRFALQDIATLTATIRLQRVHGGTALRLSGHLDADLTQTCVVSLEPVRNHVSEDFSILYAADAPTEEIAAESDSEESWAEPLPQGGLDIGEVVAQHLSLALDPYPRRADAAVEEGWAGTSETAKESPFAALAKFKTSSS